MGFLKKKMKKNEYPVGATFRQFRPHRSENRTQSTRRPLLVVGVTDRCYDHLRKTSSVWSSPPLRFPHSVLDYPQNYFLIRNTIYTNNWMMVIIGKLKGIKAANTNDTSWLKYILNNLKILLIQIKSIFFINSCKQLSRMNIMRGNSKKALWR